MFPSRDRLGRAVRAKVAAIDLDESEGGSPIAPLVVVERTPVQVAPDVDAVGDGGNKTLQRLVEEGLALLVVGGGDPVLGDQDRDAAGDLPSVTDRRREGIRAYRRSR